MPSPRKANSEAKFRAFWRQAGAPEGFLALLESVPECVAESHSGLGMQGSGNIQTRERLRQLTHFPRSSVWQAGSHLTAVCRDSRCSDSIQHLHKKEAA